MPSTDATPTAAANPPPRCTSCGQPAPILYIHGHGQCSICGTNTEPCCSGAACPSPPSTD